jgi:cytoskeletal protein CcmA (bactofilin family)
MAEASVIGQTTVVRGNVRGDGSIEIYGRVDGDVIVTGDVTLGENASVRGDVSGARLTIGGTVAGDLTGTEAVVLERSAQVSGDIEAPRVGIEEGARVRGALRTEEPGARPPAVGRGSERRSPRPAEAPSRAAEPTRAREAQTAPAARPAARPEAAQPAAAAGNRKAPPAPVVPALRGLAVRKKKTVKTQAR